MERIFQFNRKQNFAENQAIKARDSYLKKDRLQQIVRQTE